MASPFTAYRGTSAPAITAAQWGNARAGELFGRGMAQAGDAIGRALEKRKADAQETKALRSLLDTYDPDNKDLRAAMGLGELRGQRDALAMALVKQREQRDQQEHDARMAAYQRESDAASAMTSAVGQAGQQAGRTDLSNLGAALVNRGGQGLAETLHSLGDPSQRTPITADTLAQAISRNPMAAQTPLGQAILTRQMQGPDPRLRKEPEATKLGGRQIIFSPDTGQFQVLNEPAAEATVIKRPSSGEVLGLMIGGRFIEDKTKAVRVEALQKRIDNEYKTLQSMGSKNKNYAAQQEKIATLNKELDDLLTADANPAAPGQPVNPDDPLGLFSR